MRERSYQYHICVDGIRQLPLGRQISPQIGRLHSIDGGDFAHTPLDSSPQARCVSAEPCEFKRVASMLRTIFTAVRCSGFSESLSCHLKRIQMIRVFPGSELRSTDTIPIDASLCSLGSMFSTAMMIFLATACDLLSTRSIDHDAVSLFRLISSQRKSPSPFLSRSDKYQISAQSDASSGTSANNNILSGESLSHLNCYVFAGLSYSSCQSACPTCLRHPPLLGPTHAPCQHLAIFSFFPEREHGRISAMWCP